MAVLALFVVTGQASAATLTVSPPPPSTGAVGTAWNVRVAVERGPGEPSNVPTITLVNGTTGARRSIATTPTGKPDTYRASVAFDSRGTWTYEIGYGTTRTRFADAISIGTEAATGRGSGWKLLALAAAAVAIAALGTIAVLLRRRPTAAPGAPRAEPSTDVVRDRRSLIGSCLYLYDVIGDEALRGRVRDALAEAGVSELDSVGTRFDASRHRATGWVPTDDPALDGRIAEVERDGFSDRGDVLRLPEVLVYSTSKARDG